MSITEIVVLISAILIFIVVLNLVRLRRLRRRIQLAVAGSNNFLPGDGY